MLRSLGIDVVRYPYRGIISKPENVLKQNRVNLMRHHGIDLVMDVGANSGEYGKELRGLGFEGKIDSFEPLKEAFAALQLAAEGDALWQTHNFALGDHDHVTIINVAGNSVSSSMLPMMDIHQSSAPDSKYVSTESIQVKALDNLMENYQEHFNKIYLKLDVQGYEQHVLNGIQKNINSIRGIQTEMSLVELYDGETTFFEYSAKLQSMGFKLMSLEPGFYDKASGQLFQVDGIWYR